jgi:hypothetical protein
MRSLGAIFRNTLIILGVESFLDSLMSRKDISIGNTESVKAGPVCIRA